MKRMENVEGDQGEGGAGLNGGAWTGLTPQVTFNQRPKGSKGRSADVWRKNIPCKQSPWASPPCPLFSDGPPGEECFLHFSMVGKKSKGE